jgi:hypothetical protein
MSNQYPQQPQPGWGGPQQPYGQPPFQPQPPKKPSTGKIVGLGCLGVLALIVVIAIGGAIAGSGSSNDDQAGGSSDVNVTAPETSDKPTGSATNNGKKKADDKPAAKPKPKPKPKVVTFKVWGTAPAGALGPLDITYGSDSDNRDGKFSNGKFEATLPLNDDAMYYTVTAQLQGSGEINCSVTVDGKTKKGHASGGYNICDAQLSSGLFGGWN